MQILICIPFYRKLTLHEIKVFEINANLMENEFRINKINAKGRIAGHNWNKFTSKPDAKKFKTELRAQVSYSVEKDYFDDSKSILAEIKGEDIKITSDSDNDEDDHCQPSP